jgi:hypothetical protein
MERPRVKAAHTAALLPLLLAGCVPMKELRAGPDRDRLLEVARQYCAAERSAEPGDTAALFEASMRQMMEEAAPSEAAAAPSAPCVPGRSWYRGGSRTFVDVERGGRKERLDFWAGSFPLIHDVLYLPPRREGGRKVKSLRQALMFPVRAEGDAPQPPRQPDPACVPDFYNFAFLETDTKVFRQGATVKLMPSVNRQPAGEQQVPVRCTKGWAVTGPATLSADRTSLTIAPDAPVGALVTVTYTYEGKPVKAQFHVIGRDEVVLTGRYSQRSLEGCHAGDPVGELEFMPGNRFSVTYRPFESYRDYWGSYSFDPATRRLVLKPEGGNFVPPFVDLEGEAELVEGRLVLKDMFLGSRDAPPQSGCTYRF